MLTGRANWHLAETTAGDVNIEAMGLEIDLTEPLDALHEKLRTLVERESRFYHTGVQCELKMGGQSCHACTERHCGDDDPVSLLCQVGMTQEDLLEAIEIKSRASDELDELAKVTGLPAMIDLAEACA